jgi:hypothetical protein
VEGWTIFESNSATLVIEALCPMVENLLLTLVQGQLGVVGDGESLVLFA